MQVKYKLFKSSRPFGTEFEFGNSVTHQEIAKVIKSLCDRDVEITAYAQSRSNNYWHLKQDSTCGPKAHINGKDYGVELASYKGRGLKDILHISSVVEGIKTIGVETNKNCGFHIHAEVKDFSPEQIGVMLARWVKIEPVMCLIVPPHRVGNKHCKLWTKSKKFSFDEKYTGKQLWGLICPRNLAPYENEDKRVTLNFVNYAYSLMMESKGCDADRKTVELRMPEGTLNGIDVTNWVKLFLMFVDSCVDAKMPENLEPVKSVGEFFQYIGMAEENVFFILSKGMNSTKNWILSKIIKSESCANNRKSVKYWCDAKEILNRTSWGEKVEKSDKNEKIYEKTEKITTI